MASHHATGVLCLIVLCSAAGATAYAPHSPIQDVTVGDGVARTLTAGETDTVTMTFENHGRRPLPIYLVVTASTEKGIHGGEFTVDAGIFSRNTQHVNKAVLSCRFAGHRSPDTGMYLCTGDRPVLPATAQPSMNTVSTTITSTPNTAPGHYGFTVDLYSTLGIPARPSTKHPPTGNVTHIRFPNGTITLHGHPHTTVTVQPLHDVIIPPPTNTTLANTVSITTPARTVTDGSIRFNAKPSKTAGKRQIYRFTSVPGRWQPVTITHRNTTTVTARLNGSGIYGLFHSTHPAAPPAPPTDTPDSDKKTNAINTPTGGLWAQPNAAKDNAAANGTAPDESPVDETEPLTDDSDTEDDSDTGATGQQDSQTPPGQDDNTQGESGGNEDSDTPTGLIGGGSGSIYSLINNFIATIIKAIGSVF